MTTSFDSLLATEPDDRITVPGMALDSDFGRLDVGLPHDRAARIAARRAFVDMKLLFMRATAQLADGKGQWLRQQVRLANDPMDLWLLRGPVLVALRQGDSHSRQMRAELYRGLDTIFPEAFGLDGGITMPALPEPWAIWQNQPTPLPRAR